MSKRSLPPLAALQGFDAAARHLSFTKAADELFVTQGAVSRQVRQLELHLKVDLFRRFTRRIELTDAGEELHAVVGDLFERLTAVTTRIQRRTTTEVLIVSVLPTFASVWLMPRLHLFTERNPSVEVRLHTSIDPVVFGSSGPDLAIRVGRVPGWHYDRSQPRVELEMTQNWRDIHIDVLFPDRLVPLCSPELLAGRTEIPPGEIATMPLIHNSSRRFAWPDWLRAHGVSPSPGTAKDRELGHFFMSIQAARQGKGIALVPEIIAQEEIAAGNLVVPYASEVYSAGHYCLLTPDTNLERPTIVGFRSWLQMMLSQASTSSPSDQVLIDLSRRPSEA